MIQIGTYIMWFAQRYGAPEMHIMDSVDDCYSLARMLEDADTAVFDQYGILSAVEHVGHGVIADDQWNLGFEAFKAQRQTELEQSMQRSQIPKAVGCIEIRSAYQFARLGGWVHEASYSSLDTLTAELDRLQAILPASRVRSRIFRQVAE
ncbi:hypothetical protein [Rhodococcus sp. T9N]|uniref:hypothetical protein n=1 Tax=Rhodococcus sp. T9N TaxID=627445 RepID=UPI0021C3DD84|nr:hypothetical protein [Rhodococcus sp. T9N]